MENLGYFDFILLTIIALLAIRGFFVGFAKEFFGILGFVIGIFFASRFAYDAGEWFKQRIYDFDSQTFHTLIGFVIIFVVIWLIALILAVILKGAMDTLLPKYVNVILGGVFGALKSFVVLALLLYFILNFEFMKNIKSHITQNSMLYESMYSVASKIIGSKIVTNIPKSAQEIKDEVKALKQDAVGEIGNQIQEGVKTLENGAKEIIDNGKNLVEEMGK